MSLDVTGAVAVRANQGTEHGVSWCYQSSMGPQQGPVDSPRLGVSSLASSPDLSRPRNLQETVAPIKLYISEAGDYNHSAQSGQSDMCVLGGWVRGVKSWMQ